MQVVIFLADGFEEVEALTVADFLRRGGLSAVLMSVTGNRALKGCHGIKIEADTLWDDEIIKNAAAVVLPGGLPGAETLFKDERVRRVVRSFAKDKHVAAICAAPAYLGEMGLLEGKIVTCYPGFEKESFKALVVKDSAVKDGRIITGRGPGAATDFALLILEELAGKACAGKVRREIVYGEDY